MTAYIYRPDHPAADQFGCVPKEYAEPQQGSLTIIRDAEPYQSVITGEVIGGRRQHREHLREHDCIEVGNEKPRPREPVRLPDARHDVKAAMDMVRSGHRPAPLETLKDWSR